MAESNSGPMSRRAFVRAGFALPVAAGLAGAAAPAPAEPEKDAAAATPVPAWPEVLRKAGYDPPEPNPRPAERMCIALWAVLDACKDMLAEPDHGEDCGCQFCEDGRGLHYFCEMTSDCLSSLLLPFPEMDDRHAREARESGDLERARFWELAAERSRLKRQQEAEGGRAG